MAVSTTSTVSGTVKATYESDYIEWLSRNAIWRSIVNWRGQSGVKGLKGSSIGFPVQERLDRVTSATSEDADVTPVLGKVTNVDVTIVERTGAVQKSALLEKTNYADLSKIFAAEVAAQQIESVDYYIANAALASAYSVRGLFSDNVDTRATLAVGTHLPDYQSIIELEAMAVGMGTEPYDDGTFVSVVATQGMAELRQIAELVAVSEYSDPTMFYTGKPGTTLGGKRFPGEEFRIGKIRFIEHPWGKVYLSAGAGGQATTIDADAAAGAVAISVADATGIAVGNFLTLGTVETSTTRQPTTEQVRVISVSGTDIGVQGMGNSITNSGLKYAHSSGAACTEADNAFAVPIFGKNSVNGYFDSELSLDGEQQVHPHGEIVIGRHIDYAWWWVGGVTAIAKYCVRGEYATRVPVFGHS